MPSKLFYMLPMPKHRKVGFVCLRCWYTSCSGGCRALHNIGYMFIRPIKVFDYIPKINSDYYKLFLTTFLC